MGVAISAIAMAKESIATFDPLKLRRCRVGAAGTNVVEAWLIVAGKGGRALPGIPFGGKASLDTETGCCLMGVSSVDCCQEPGGVGTNVDENA
jgi:hypothetical protein